MVCVITCDKSCVCVCMWHVQMPQCVQYDNKESSSQLAMCTTAHSLFPASSTYSKANTLCLENESIKRSHLSVLLLLLLLTFNNGQQR
jgi:hypothetical protein